MTASAGGGLATGRLRLPGGQAPGGLGLVQELVNTSPRVPHDSGRLADLLAEPDAAAAWLSRALEQWAEATGQPVPELSLGPADLAPLREVREAVRELAGPGQPASAGPPAAGSARPGQPASAGPAAAGLSELGLTLRLGPDGRVSYGPAGPGWRGVAALVAAEILLAQQRGQWPRFKSCPHQRCGIAFYDSSRNASRVWHDVSTCGNQTNLRAYRARRKDATSS
jgi:predicted RNA-binding Zn ribbon-like protein